MRPRLSIAASLGVVALCGVGLAAFRTGSPLLASMWYTATAAVLVLAAYRALRCRGPFWSGFALAGWAHLLLTRDHVGDPSTRVYLFTVYVAEAATRWKSEGFAAAKQDIDWILSFRSDLYSLHVAMSAMTLFVAFLGGILASSFSRVRGSEL